MITPIPHAYIDSWDDLYGWTHLKIITSPYNRIKHFADTETTEMAANFRPRIEAYMSDSSNDRMTFGHHVMSSMDYATVLSRPILLSMVARFKNHSPQLLSSMYISRYGGGQLSYFIAVNTLIGRHLNSLNKM